MHETQLGYEQQYQVKDPAGNVLWVGGAIVGQGYVVINNGAAWLAGSPIVVDPLTTIAGNYNPSSADALIVALYGVRCTATTNVGFLGVSLAPAAVSTASPRPGESLVAGTGSIAATQFVSPTTSLVGDTVGGSATAGQAAVAAIAGATANVSGRSLGVTVKAVATLGTTNVPTGYSGLVGGVLICPS